MFARYDCLALLRPLPALSGVSAAASFFVRRRAGLLPDRLEKMMSEESDPLLNVFITELGCRYSLSMPRSAADSPLLFTQDIRREDADFYYELFRDVIRRSPRLKPLYNSFRHRCDLLQDKRLYASELEKLLDKTAASPLAAKFDIDWKLTGREDIFINYDDGCRFTDSLDVEEQKKLAALWGFLFFIGETLILSWANVIVDSQGRLNFFNIDSLTDVDCGLKNFTVKLLQKQAAPQSFSEYKIEASLKCLRGFCPDVDLAETLHEYIVQAPYVPEVIEKPDEKYLDSLCRTEFGVGLRRPEKTIDAESLAYLLDSRREQRMRKRRPNPFVRIVLPFLIMLLLMYRFF